MCVQRRATSCTPRVRALQIDAKVMLFHNGMNGTLARAGILGVSRVESTAFRFKTRVHKLRWWLHYKEGAIECVDPTKALQYLDCVSHQPVEFFAYRQRCRRRRSLRGTSLPV